MTRLANKTISYPALERAWYIGSVSLFTLTPVHYGAEVWRAAG